jgi:hypothetical protein
MVAATISTIAVPKYSILPLLQAPDPHPDAAVQMTDHDSSYDHYHSSCPRGYPEINFVQD